MRRLAAQLARCLPPADTRPDADLLAAFRGGGPGAEPAFAELVRRHGPMVWGVCRRHLPDAADAEDAFQAVFLVLVRKAGGLRRLPTLAPWLHRVAAWTARNVRRRNARRMARQAPLPDQLPAASSDPDLPLDLDSALLALPEKYRSPIVLCHLLGFTRAEAAERLNCPEGTLSGWLTRGLDKLRTKLGGLDPARSLGLAAAVPMGLAASAVRAAVASQTAAAVIPLAVSRIAEGVIHMFWVKKATAATTALFAVFAMGVGVGMSGRQVVGVADGQEKGVPGVVLSAPEPDVEVVVGDLEREIQLAQAELEAFHTYLKRANEVIKVGRVDRAYLDTTKRAAEQAVQKAADLAKLEERLAKLKAAGQPPAKDKPKPADPTVADLAKIDEMLKRLQAQLELEKAARIQDPKAKFAQLERAIEELAAKRDELLAQRQPERRKPLGIPADLAKQLQDAEARFAERARLFEAQQQKARAELEAMRAEIEAMRKGKPPAADPNKRPLGDPVKPIDPAKLLGEQVKPAAQADLDAQLRDLQKQLQNLAAERQRAAAQRAVAEQEAAALAERERAIRLAAEELAAARAKVAKPAQPESRKPLADPTNPKAAEFEKQLADLKALLSRTMVQRDALADKTKEIEAAIKELITRQAGGGKQPQPDPRAEPRKPLGDPVKPAAQADLDAKVKELRQAVEALAAERQEIERHRDVIAEKEKALRAAADELAARHKAETKKVKPGDRPRP